MPIGDDEWNAGTIKDINDKQDKKETPRYNLAVDYNCRCCHHPNIEDIDRQFLNKEISGIEAAEMLDVSPNYYSIHITRDVRKPAATSIATQMTKALVVSTTLEQVMRMKNLLKLLVDRAEELFSEPMNIKNELRIKAIISEARSTAEFLLRAEGQLQDSPLIVIESMNVNFQKVIELVMAEADPKLKQKISMVLADRPPEQLPSDTQ